MAEEYTERISEIKVCIVRKELELIDIYFERIKKIYSTLNAVQKEALDRGLEALIKGAEIGEIPMFYKPRPLIDPAKAKEVRINSGLSLRTLSSKLGLSYSAILNYESGRVKNLSAEDTKTRKYIEWLKEQGYNPFNL